MKNSFETIDLSLLGGVTGGKKDEKKKEKKSKKEEKPAGPDPSALLAKGTQGIMTVGQVMEAMTAPPQQ